MHRRTQRKNDLGSRIITINFGRGLERFRHVHDTPVDGFEVVLLSVVVGVDESETMETLPQPEKRRGGIQNWP